MRQRQGDGPKGACSTPGLTCWWCSDRGVVLDAKSGAECIGKLQETRSATYIGPGRGEGEELRKTPAGLAEALEGRGCHQLSQGSLRWGWSAGRASARPQFAHICLRGLLRIEITQAGASLSLEFRSKLQPGETYLDVLSIWLEVKA